MLKKRISTLLVLVMLAALLAACGGGGQAPASVSAPAEAEAAPARASNISVTVSNATDYNFNELYVSPTATNEWGTDHLGSTSILKKNGSFDISLPAYDYDSYDILVVDEDEAEYLFTRATLQNGCELMITFGDGGLAAITVLADGTESIVYGSLDTGYDSGEDGLGDTFEDTEPDYELNGNDTAGRFSFEAYNESSYDIYAIYMGIQNASSAYDLDVLPQILYAGDSTTISGQASQGDWMNTDWTLYIEDVDGDTSASFEVFNPWILSYVDIYWDNSSGGYVCDFYY